MEIRMIGGTAWHEVWRRGQCVERARGVAWRASTLAIGIITIIALAVFPLQSAQAQAGTGSAGTGSEGEGGVTSAVADAVSGTIEARSEAYTVSGIDERRPNLSAQTSALLRLDKWGFTTDVTLLYTTESSQLRQSMNRLGFDLEFEWGRIGAGDVSPTFSKYSLSGVTVRGGYVNLQPGPLLFSAVAGRAQEAVQPNETLTERRLRLRGAAYARWLYGVRVGLGNAGGTHLHLNGIVARDDVSSIDVDRSLLPPTENLALTPDVGLTLFDGAFDLQGSLTASIYTDDTDAPTGDAVPLNGVYDWVFTPRTSSRLGLATETSLTLDFERAGVEAVYERVDPGFRSLGTSQFQSDVRTIRVAPRASFFQNVVSVRGEYSTETNNILDTRSGTMTRNQMALSTTLTPSSTFTLSTNARRLGIANEPGENVPDPILTEQAQTMYLISASPTFNLRRGRTSHTASLTGAWNRLTDSSPAVEQGLRPATDFRSVSTTGSYSIVLPSSFRVNSSVSYTRSNASVSETSNWSVTLGSGYAFLNRTLQVNASGSYVGNTITQRPVAGGLTEQLDVVSNQWVGTASMSYRAVDDGTFQLNVRGTSSTSTITGRDFEELSATLRYRHRL